MISFKNQVLTPKSPGMVEFFSNWNNDEGTYYPYIIATYIFEGVLETERYSLGETGSPEKLKKDLVYRVDGSQAYDLECHFKRVRQGLEDNIIRKGKVLEVVRGRKVPLGTIGVCFWVGQTVYGESVGIRTDSGTFFTARSNVVVIK